MSNKIKYEQSILATIYFLKELNIKVTSSSVASEIEKHPDYPSLLSISDSLKKWNVPNRAFNITDSMDNVLFPFITFWQNQFIVVKSFMESEVVFYSSTTTPKSISKKRFIDSWNKICLYAFKNNQSGEDDYYLKRIMFLIDSYGFQVSIVLFVTLIAFLVPISRYSFHFLYSIILKLIGLTISCTLLDFEMNVENSFVNKICSFAKNNLNCKAVLTSKYSKPFRYASWSEIGFIYFTGELLFTLVMTTLGLNLNLLAFLNTTSLLFVVYSLFIQWKVIKKWCLICIAVQSVFILENINNYYSNIKYNLELSSIEAVIFIISFLIPFIFWELYSSFTLRRVVSNNLSSQLSKLKCNPDIFNYLLANQKEITYPPDGLGIILGNSESNNLIVQVCNPYCVPCSRMHFDIEKLIASNSDIKVQTIFTIGNNSDYDESLPIKVIMAIDEQGDKNKTVQILGQWFTERSAFNLIKDNPDIGDLSIQSIKIEKMLFWCREMKIRYTPTIFLNGRELPELYSIRDLEYLVDYMQQNNEK